MAEKAFFFIGTVYGFLGVAAGAFGAHALKAKLAPEMLKVFETAVRYQMFHAVTLLVMAWAVTHYHQALVTAAGWFFAAGVFIFSGSLYVLAVSGVKMWGAVTPLGGLLFLMGWLSLAVSVFKS